MNYSVLALVTASTVLGVAYNVVWSNELLALITMVWLLRFVFMVIKLMVGVSQAQISNNLDIFRATVVYLTQITAIGVLYFTEYYFCVYRGYSFSINFWVCRWNVNSYHSWHN